MKLIYLIILSVLLGNVRVAFCGLTRNEADDIGKYLGIKLEANDIRQFIRIMNWSSLEGSLKEAKSVWPSLKIVVLTKKSSVKSRIDFRDSEVSDADLELFQSFQAADYWPGELAPPGGG